MKRIIKTKLLDPITNFISFLIELNKKYKEFKLLEDVHIKTEYECMWCKKVYDEAQKCECGGTSYIVNPGKYTIKGNDILCGCEKSELEYYCHSDSTNGFANHYICSNCDNKIIIFQYMERERYKG